MEQNVRIADMEKGQLVQGFYLLEDVRCRVSASGSPYISARIADASGEMAAKLWNYNGPITEADSGRAVLLRGEVGEFAGAPQFTIQRIRLATEKDNFDRRALVPCAPLDPDEALAEVRELLASMGDGDYRTLCETMLERHLETFRSIPAAKSVHHAFLSGLLMHTLHMLRTADFFAALYAGVIDRDLLLAGAFLHDLGKETELGRCEDFIDDWMDFGISSWNPAQPSNDLVGIKKKWGRKLIIAGGWDTQSSLSYDGADEETLRAALMKYVDDLAPNGAFVFSAFVMGKPEDRKRNMEIVNDVYENYAKNYYQTH